jgi:outer membrane murein-binding lipoprotein Lpp
MKKATFLLPIIFLAVGIAAYGIDLQNYGFNVTNTQQENNQTVYTVQTSDGFTFTVASSAPLTDSNAKVLKTSVSTLAGWKLLKIQQAKIVFNGSRADILIIPASFVYKGVDLAKYMPSGIQFYFDTYLQYDFRMLKDNLFLRLKGEVYDETQFADRLYSAVENPVLYLQTNNPEYLLLQINALTKKIDNLTTQIEQTNAAFSQLTDKVDALAKAGQDFTTKQEAVNSKVENQIGDIKVQNQTMADEFDLLRYSLLILNNRGFFGQIRLIDKQAIAKVVQMKKEDSALTQDQVMAKLQAEGIKMSKKEVSLVFGVYFNEFK